MTDVPQVFELGQIMVDGAGPIYVEEITVNTTQELHTYYTTDSFDPKAVRPGRRKYDFTIKRAEDRSKSGQTFRKLFEQQNTGKTGTNPKDGFDLTIYALNVGNEVATPEKLFTLTGCRLSKDNLGNFDTSKPVQNDLEGQATGRDLPS